MVTYIARDLLRFSTTELWEILTGNFKLQFDDGVIETNHKQTLFSSYAWEFHRNFPDTPLLTKHHVKSVIGNNRLTTDTHLKLLGNVVWSVYDVEVAKIPNINLKEYQEEEYKLRDFLAERVYRTTNVIYNDLIYRLEEYVETLDVLDFYDALKHPKIKEANTKVQSIFDNIPIENLADYCKLNRNQVQAAIDTAHATIKEVLLDPTSFKHNAISNSAQAKLSNMGQILQCVGPRGFLTDVDSNVFPVPILRGFGQGIRQFRDLLIESRSAAKSLGFSKTPLQQAEYFSRRLQLMTQILKNLHMGDCGSQHYLHWHVRDESYSAHQDYEENDGIENPVKQVLKRKGDLPQLAGKYYLDEETGELKVIKASDKFLIGKTLRIRSPLHCSHPDPYGICSVCFGKLALSVPKNTNIGQYCSTHLASQSSQNVMSVKHYDGSSAVEGIVMDKESSRYLKVAKDGNSYLLNDTLKGKGCKLIIAQSEASNIGDIFHVTNVEELNITRVSEIKQIGISISVAGSNMIIPIDVNVGRRLASLTYAMLKYIKVAGYRINENENFEIDLKDWDISKPLLTLPLKHINMSDHSSDIAHMLESSVKQLQERDTDTDADAVLVELYDLVNEKLTVNLAVLECVLYATMVVSNSKNDFSLPKTWTERSLGVMRYSMQNRSLSAAMAFQGHRDVIINPNSFVYTNRTDHIFDKLLIPGASIPK